MKPKDEIKLDIAELDKPSEQHGDQKRKANDFICSDNTFRLDQFTEEPGNHGLYYLQDKFDRAFVPEKIDAYFRGYSNIP